MPRLTGLALVVLAAACAVKPVALAPGEGADATPAPLADGAPAPEVTPLADTASQVPEAGLQIDAAADVPILADAARDTAAPDAARDAAAAPDLPRVLDVPVFPDIEPDPIVPEPDAAAPPADLAPDVAPPSPDLPAATPDLAPDVAPPPPDLAPEAGPEANLPPPPSHELVFVANQDSNDITVFVVDPATGARTSPPGSPFPTSERPRDLVITPDGKFLYACHYTTEDLRGFRVAADGRLTALPDAYSLPHCEAMVISPGGRFLYASGVDGLLYGFTADASTGALTAMAGTPVAGVQGVQGLAADPQGRFVAVTVRLDAAGTGKVRLLAIDPGSGALQPASEALISSSLPGDSPALAFDPAGAFIYGATGGPGGADQIFGFAVGAAGALTAVPGSPWPGADEGSSFSFHPTRPLVYYGSTGFLMTLRRGAGGVLSEEPGSPTFFNNDTDAALSTTGNFLYVLHQGEDEVTVSRIGASGLPEPFSGSPWKTGGTNPWRIVVWAPPSF